VLWGRIKEGAERADMTKKSRWRFYYPPLNPLPHSGRGDVGGFFRKREGR